VIAVERQGRTSLRLSFVEVQLLREHLAGTAILGSANLQPLVIRVHGADVQTMAEVVDAPYFNLTGTQAVIGRMLLSADDRAEAAPATVISEPFWRRRFAASPDVLGQTLALNGQSFIVVGVAGATGSASAVGASVDAWVPVAHADLLLNRGWRTNLDDRWFASFALPQAGPGELAARLSSASSALARLHPDPSRERRFETSPATVLTGAQRGTAMMLTGILAALGLLILATAASNVAGVFLARVAATRRQVAIHLAIGSGRAAIVRRQIVEGATLGLAAAALSIALYAWGRVLLAEVALLPTLALRLDLPLDGSLVLIVAATGVLAGMALALGPALWAARVNLADAIRDGDAWASGGRGLARLRRLLVATEVCLSLVLMVGAALFGQSLQALAQADVGFRRERLVALDFDVEPAGQAMSELAGFGREALARVQALPGVTAAAMSNRAPIDQSTPTLDLRASSGDLTLVGDVTFYLATSGYFDTVGVPLVHGRSFTAAEAESAADVAIVNEALAVRLWPGGDALDRSVYIEREAKTVRIVGVARNSKYRSIRETRRLHLYRPTPARLGLTLLARTSSDPREALRDIQNTLARVGPGLVGFFPRTLDDHLAIELLPTRAAASAASILGALALILTGVGLYGLVSWFVELRGREIGIRMALGASRSDVRRLVVGQAMATALPGIVAGVVLSAALGTLTSAALYGVTPVDPLALATGTGLLTVVVITAAYAPSRRASRVDPATTLRQG